MFEIALTLMNQLVDLIIPCIGLYILFDLIGALIFNKR